MSVCVRLDENQVGEFPSITDTVEQPNTKAVGLAPDVLCQSSVSGTEDSCAESGVATPARLAELQARSDEAAAAGCRVA